MSFWLRNTLFLDFFYLVHYDIYIKSVSGAGAHLCMTRCGRLARSCGVHGLFFIYGGYAVVTVLDAAIFDRLLFCCPKFG